jgi:ribonuclease R
MSAERETTDRLIAAHLADRIGATFKARIGGVTRSGLFVKLNDTGADGFVPISSLGNEFYTHIEEAHALVGSRSGEAYRLGDAGAVGQTVGQLAKLKGLMSRRPKQRRYGPPRRR